MAQHRYHRDNHLHPAARTTVLVLEGFLTPFFFFFFSQKVLGLRGSAHLTQKLMLKVKTESENPINLQTSRKHSGVRFLHSRGWVTGSRPFMVDNVNLSCRGELREGSKITRSILSRLDSMATDVKEIRKPWCSGVICG